jgi:dolichol kinase
MEHLSISKMESLPVCQIAGPCTDAVSALIGRSYGSRKRD